MPPRCTELPGNPDDPQARYIEAAVNGVLITSLYAPNGNPQPGPKFKYKLDWMDRLGVHATELLAANVPVVLAGDFNVVPTDLDIYPRNSYAKDALLAPEARTRFERLLDAAGATPFAQSIPTRRCTPIGATCETAGRAMPGCASTICC